MHNFGDIAFFLWHLVVPNSLAEVTVSRKYKFSVVVVVFSQFIYAHRAGQCGEFIGMGNSML